MEKRELLHLIAATVILMVVGSFTSLLEGSWKVLPRHFVYAVVIIGAYTGVRKLTAHLLDAAVEHELWTMQRFGLKPHHYLETPAPTGVLVPLFCSLFSAGFAKVTPVLTYEVRANKYRAAKRFGYYSHAAITDWHNALIGASGILATLILAIIAYFINAEPLAKLAAYHAFTNIMPFSKLDGTQILFGSRILYTVVALLTLVCFMYALLF